MKKITLIAAMMLATGWALAQPAAPVTGHGPHTVPPKPVAEFDKGSPAGLLQQGIGDLLKYVALHRGEPQKLKEYLEKDVAPHFDFEYMAASAAGPMQAYMSDEQKQKMAERIKAEFLSTLVQRLSGYNNQQVRILSQRIANDGRTATVTAGILGARGYPTRLDFRFYKSKDGWKVFDVMANGQSAVVHYRRQFRQMMMPPMRGGFQPLPPRQGYGYHPYN